MRQRHAAMFSSADNKVADFLHDLLGSGEKMPEVISDIGQIARAEAVRASAKFEVLF